MFAQTLPLISLACAVIHAGQRKTNIQGEIPKADFQMRDLRAKAATDKQESTGHIRAARDQLRHTTVGMTEQYIRMRKGMKVTPTK